MTLSNKIPAFEQGSLLLADILPEVIADVIRGTPKEQHNAKALLAKIALDYDAMREEIVLRAENG